MKLNHSSLRSLRHKYYRYFSQIRDWITNKFKINSRWKFEFIVWSCSWSRWEKLPNKMKSCRYCSPCVQWLTPGWNNNNSCIFYFPVTILLWDNDYQLKLLVQYSILAKHFELNIRTWFYFYRSGTLNSNTVNPKFHLIRSFFEIFARFLSFHV